MLNVESAKFAYGSQIPWFSHGYRGAGKQQSAETSRQVAQMFDFLWNCGDSLESIAVTLF
jgi:hypothetical protein